MIIGDQKFISKELEKKIYIKLEFLYGKEKVQKIYHRLIEILIKFQKSQGKKNIKNILRKKMSHKDSIFITYPDSIQNFNVDELPLKTLKNFTVSYLKGFINIIHILPFFSYSSDRGFSIIDYKKVNKRFGTWGNINSFNKHFELMFDFVCNHISDQSVWFKKFSKGEAKFKYYFIAFKEEDKPINKELNKVFRPRSSELLVPYNLSIGERWIWRTFLKDQIDLNFKNEEVFLQMVNILLFYVSKKANLIRLDAIAFIWKELSTNCINLPQTHTIIQLFRDVLDIVAPHVALVTETNIPHKDNISYFGDGTNEAQMVYNFALPPLVIHTIQTGNVVKISKWAESFKKISNQVIFLNFLDSHDGIGIMGVKDILTRKEIQNMINKIVNYGGLISYKKNFNESESPYEINSTWWNTINSDQNKENEKIKIKRYFASRAIVLSLRGIPGIYINGLLGLSNNINGYQKTKYKRDINRENLNSQKLFSELNNFTSRQSKIFRNYLRLIRLRSQESAFHPNGKQEVLFLKKEIFILFRTDPTRKKIIFVFINVSNNDQKLIFDLNKIKIEKYKFFLDIISKKIFLVNKDKQLEIVFKPYDIFWLKPTI